MIPASDPSRRTRLVVALDVPDAPLALKTARSFAGLDLWLKVGLELFTAEGPDIVRKLTDLGFPVFLDMKFHDIPNTVAGAVASAVRTGASMLTLHLSGGSAMAEAAVAARDRADRTDRAQTGGVPPLLLGVTVLTSTGPADGENMADIVREKALAAKAYGLDGVVCSGQEAAVVKEACGDGFICLCPGIRPAGTQTNDQARVCTPLQAMRNGADFLVMGRPVLSATDPATAAARILDELRGARQA